MQRLAQRPARFVLLAATPLVAERQLPKHKDLPIYPTESPKPVVVESPTQLEDGIRQSREVVTEGYRVGRAHVQMVVDRWIGVEHAVESRLKSLAPPPETEPLFPGALWVGIAALSGSIVAQQLRPTLMRRIIYPPVWGLIAANYFLPLHTVNVGKYVYELEERYVPNLAKAQSRLAERMIEASASSRESFGRFQTQLDVQVGKTKQWIQANTGLQIADKSQEEKK
ncbi:MICOS complex subunit {ECO:0000256/RuleBase:RU363021} [Serendipita indica DSM 11827]|nr:MICOS complex subunit {ECO:0000256/RuleBase:RU363021} [Serendipita indica DSM 11827]